MKRKNKEFKACANCEHFKMHYVKSRTGYYVATGCGACSVKVFNEEEKSKLPYEYFCDSWRAVQRSNCGLDEIKEKLLEISVRFNEVLNDVAKKL